MKDKNYRFEKRFCDYYVDKLCETTAKTQNEFYAECGEEIVRLRRKIELQEKEIASRGLHAQQLEYQIIELKKEIEGHQAFQRSVNEALNSGDGSYRP